MKKNTITAGSTVMIGGDPERMEIVTEIRKPQAPDEVTLYVMSNGDMYWAEDIEAA